MKRRAFLGGLLSIAVAPLAMSATSLKAAEVIKPAPNVGRGLTHAIGYFVMVDEEGNPVDRDYFNAWTSQPGVSKHTIDSSDVGVNYFKTKPESFTPCHHMHDIDQDYGWAKHLHKIPGSRLS